MSSFIELGGLLFVHIYIHGNKFINQHDLS